MNCADIVTYLDTEYEHLQRRLIAHGTRDLQLAQVDKINEVLFARLVPIVTPGVTGVIPEGTHRDDWLEAMSKKWGKMSERSWLLLFVTLVCLQACRLKTCFLPRSER